MQIGENAYANQPKRICNLHKMDMRFCMEAIANDRKGMLHFNKRAYNI